MDLLCLDASKRFAAAFSRSTREDAALADGLNLVTIRAVSQKCSASLETRALWRRTGLWALARADSGDARDCRRSGMEGWLATGAWPGSADVQYQRAEQREA